MREQTFSPITDTCRLYISYTTDIHIYIRTSTEDRFMVSLTPLVSLFLPSSRPQHEFPDRQRDGISCKHRQVFISPARDTLVHRLVRVRGPRVSIGQQGHVLLPIPGNV